MIPLSEDGASLLEDLEEESYPNRLTGTNGLFLHENEQSLIKPKEAYTTEAHGLMLEDNDYIYNIFMVSGGMRSSRRTSSSDHETRQTKTYSDP